MKKVLMFFIAAVLVMSFSGCDEQAIKEIEQMEEELESERASASAQAAASEQAVVSAGNHLEAFFNGPQQYIYDSIVNLPGFDDLLKNPELFPDGKPEIQDFWFNSYSKTFDDYNDFALNETPRYNISLLPQQDSWTPEFLGDLVGGILKIDYTPDIVTMTDENGEEKQQAYMIGEGEYYPESYLYYDYYDQGKKYLQIEFVYSEPNNLFAGLAADSFDWKADQVPDELGGYEWSYQVQYGINQYAFSCKTGEDPQPTGMVTKTWWQVSEDDMQTIRDSLSDNGFTMLTDSNAYSNGYIKLDDNFFDTLWVSIMDWSGEEEPVFNIEYGLSLKVKF